jgi:hypothetical protein
MLTPHIRFLQTRLAALGHYTGAIDGQRGPTPPSSRRCPSSANRSRQIGMAGQPNVRPPPRCK